MAVVLLEAQNGKTACNMIGVTLKLVVKKVVPEFLHVIPTPNESKSNSSRY